MNIILFNQDWFAKELRAMGHRVLTCAPEEYCDIVLESPLCNLHYLLEKAPADFTPDLLIFHDNSAPVIITGVEECEIPTLFYSVDTHHHFELHCNLYQVFDKMMSAQRDYIPGFNAAGLDVPWMPLWASGYAEQSLDKKHGAVFVGTLDSHLNPDRVKFFEALQKISPVFVTSGNFWEIFPYSEIVVNQTVRGDLNFRVFESMMCGVALLTEASGNGLLELFRDGEHLVTYEKGNITDAANKINDLLADPVRMRRIAKAGRDEIMRAHLPVHRAERIMAEVQGITKRNSPIRCYSAMANFNSLRRRQTKINPDLAHRALIVSMKQAEQAHQRGEKLNDELAFHFTTLCLRYDRDMHCRLGYNLMQEVAEANPTIPVLALALMREKLNQGAREEALNLARRFEGDDPTRLFSHAEKVVAALLDTEDLDLGK